MQDEEPDQEDRWESLVEDPCEHKYLRVGINGFVCAVCEEPVRFSPHDLVKDDGPPSRT